LAVGGCARLGAGAAWCAAGAGGWGGSASSAVAALDPPAESEGVGGAMAGGGRGSRTSLGRRREREPREGRWIGNLLTRRGRRGSRARRERRRETPLGWVAPRRSDGDDAGSRRRERERSRRGGGVETTREGGGFPTERKKRRALLPKNSRGARGGGTRRAGAGREGAIGSVARYRYGSDPLAEAPHTAANGRAAGQWPPRATERRPRRCERGTASEDFFLETSIFRRDERAHGQSVWEKIARGHCPVFRRAIRSRPVFENCQTRSVRWILRALIHEYLASRQPRLA
jgi:hypothetical protein